MSNIIHERNKASLVKYKDGRDKIMEKYIYDRWDKVFLESDQEQIMILEKEISDYEGVMGSISAIMK